MRSLAIGIMTLFVVALTACGAGSEVAVSFRSGSATTTQTLSQGLSADVVGTNGTLTIEDLRIIVAEVELEAVDGACEAVPTAGADDEDEVECEEFEAGPYLIQVPLDGSAVQAVREPVAYGTYNKLEFEIEDVSFDEEDEDQVALQNLRDDLVAAGFESWPSEASIFVAGRYLPAGGAEAQPFELYLDAEVEIEMEFPQPMVIDETHGSVDVTVDIDPARWFTNEDGTVVDLSQYLPGQLIELEHDVEVGFSGVEVETELDGHEDAADDS